MDVQHRLAILLHLPRSFALPVPKDWSHLLVCFSPSPLFNFSWLLWLIFHCFVVQPLSGVQFFVTPWRYIYISPHQASQSFTISQTLLKFMSFESVMPSNHLILCHPLLLLPSIFPSIRVISNESVLRIRWPKYWSFSFSISLFNEYSGLISFRMDCLDLLAVQESFPTSQFKNINSLVLSLLYGPRLTSTHDFWKNHSFDQTELAKWCCFLTHIPVSQETSQVFWHFHLFKIFP